MYPSIDHSLDFIFYLYSISADDGQNTFLHSINARCLIEEYGSLSSGPVKITGQIIDFDYFTMTRVCSVLI